MITKMYVWANVMNLLCYKTGKTIEFRFLRPTYNLHKILLWMYVFNAILIYAENLSKTITATNEKYIIRKIRTNFTGLSGIIHSVYPNEVAEKIMDEMQLLSFVVCNQESNHDYIGATIDLENSVIDPNTLI